MSPAPCVLSFLPSASPGVGRPHPSKRKPRLLGNLGLETADKVRRYTRVLRVRLFNAGERGLYGVNVGAQVAAIRGSACAR